MGYLIVKKSTINGETKVVTYAETEELEAKRRYHSTLAQAYANTDGLEHVLCTLENDYGGQILKEYYFAPTPEPEVEEPTPEPEPEPEEPAPEEEPTT